LRGEVRPPGDCEWLMRSAVANITSCYQTHLGLSGLPLTAGGGMKESAGRAKIAARPLCSSPHEEKNTANRTGKIGAPKTDGTNTDYIGIPFHVYQQCIATDS